MQITYTKNFLKSYKKRDSKIQLKFDEKVEIFVENPFEKILNNHKLYWVYEGLRSINITWDYRAIFRELSEGRYEFVEFLYIGSHSELYK